MLDIVVDDVEHPEESDIIPSALIEPYLHLLVAEWVVDCVLKHCFEVPEYLLDVFLEVGVCLELNHLHEVVFLGFAGLLVKVGHAPCLILVILKTVEVVVEGLLTHLEHYGLDVRAVDGELSLSYMVESIPALLVLKHKDRPRFLLDFDPILDGEVLGDDPSDGVPGGVEV